MMPHINDLAKGRDKWQRDLNRSVLIVLALLTVAAAGIIWSFVWTFLSSLAFAWSWRGCWNDQEQQSEQGASMMPHIHTLSRNKDKWQRDLTRTVLTILALILMAVAGIIWSLVWTQHWTRSGRIAHVLTAGKSYWQTLARLRLTTSRCRWLLSLKATALTMQFGASAQLTDETEKLGCLP